MFNKCFLASVLRFAGASIDVDAERSNGQNKKFAWDQKKIGAPPFNNLCYVQTFNRIFIGTAVGTRWQKFSNLIGGRKSDVEAADNWVMLPAGY